MLPCSCATVVAPSPSACRCPCLGRARPPPPGERQACVTQVIHPRSAERTATPRHRAPSSCTLFRPAKRALRERTGPSELEVLLEPHLEPHRNGLRVLARTHARTQARYHGFTFTCARESKTNGTGTSTLFSIPRHFPFSRPPRFWTTRTTLRARGRGRGIPL